jgi:GH35 family endo-1,4-beta-xylanase
MTLQLMLWVCRGMIFSDFTPQQLKTNLDRLAALGLPIFITELDIPRDK